MYCLMMLSGGPLAEPAKYEPDQSWLSAKLTPEQLHSPITPPQSPTPSWGLDRIDQHYLPLNDRYWWLTTGRGVRAYVIDIGVRASHPDIYGRVLTGYDSVDNDGNPDDCNGLGTGVAGVIGGRTYGVAKEAWIVPVRVLNCSGSGTYSGVIAGIDWVIRNAVKPATVSMTLGGGANAAVDDAVNRLLASGISASVAAGASNSSACNFSPARVPGALTVGASDANDYRASFSNWGTCLDLFSPGVNITTIWNNGGTYTLSGTSMATAHVVGVAALYLQMYPGATAQQVHDAINRNATAVIQNPGTGSPNRLLCPLIT
jgi:subtilisin family serine protease